MVSKRYFQYKENLPQNNDNFTGHATVVYDPRLKVILNQDLPNNHKKKRVIYTKRNYSK